MLMEKRIAKEAADKTQFNLSAVNGVKPSTVTAEESAALTYGFVEFLRGKI
jgi:hypothetical protein